MTISPSLAATEAEGERVVSLDYGLASTMLALGVTPTGVVSLKNWDEWVAEPRMPPGVIDLGTTAEINLEVLVSIRPSLILSTPFLAALDGKLSAIAPVATFTIYAEGGEALDRSYIETLRLAEILNRSNQARRFLADADAFFDRLKERIRRFSPPPVAVINFVDQRHARIYGGPGLYGGTMKRIGLENAWNGQANYWGFETIGLERLAELDEGTHLIAVAPLMPSDVFSRLQESPLWTSLPFVRRDRVSTIPGVLMFGMVQEAMRFAALVADKIEAAHR
ncbi:iron-siderophore ABC transporter substrate-binding protein [Neorhizobium alkalisoli]|uniref:iron-siderophore ABC transporter substrate-binding protein n=1 Tax=Neorhizobium alkalisoli TaxID=528178 RepID=UPI000CFA7F25|nr:iron-siderophore ABC transporter substrate-binding protein [Neorhizobium alkalisoli]